MLEVFDGDGGKAATDYGEGAEGLRQRRRLRQRPDRRGTEAGERSDLSVHSCKRHYQRWVEVICRLVTGMNKMSCLFNIPVFPDV